MLSTIELCGITALFGVFLETNMKISWDLDSLLKYEVRPISLVLQVESSKLDYIYKDDKLLA